MARGLTLNDWLVWVNGAGACQDSTAKLMKAISSKQSKKEYVNSLDLGELRWFARMYGIGDEANAHIGNRYFCDLGCCGKREDREKYREYVEGVLLSL